MELYKIAYAYRDGLLEITESDARILTHINIAFGLINDDGSLRTDCLCHMERLKQIREWNPSIRIVLSVGGWEMDGFSQMTRTPEGIRRFVADCASYVQEQGLDGIDIDWEYPCIDWAGIEADPSDKFNYTKLLEELRRVLGPEKIVSVAVGSGDYFIENTEMRKVGEICDYVQLMTYDMRAGECYIAGHHTALYSAAGDHEGRSVHDTVMRYKNAGVPVEKMLIGAAFYSRVWYGVRSTENNGLLQPAESNGTYGYTYTQIRNEMIGKNEWVRFYDERARASYLFNGNELVSYDDPDSIAEKCRYIKEIGLLGIMYWEHGCDKTHELIESIGRNL